MDVINFLNGSDHSVNNLNDSDYSYYWDYSYYYDEIEFDPNEGFFIPEGVTDVVAWIVICVGLPLTLMAIYFLLLLVREGHEASVYVINLLISDLIQISCLVIYVTQDRQAFVTFISRKVHFMGLLASVGFMVCIALERYLVIAWPLWYRFKRSVRLSVIASIIVWALSITQIITAMLLPQSFELIFCCILLLLPFPILIFSLVGSLKALSRAIAVPPKEKRKIMGTLVLVLLIYTLLFLPTVIDVMQRSLSSSFYFFRDLSFGLPFLFLLFSPLADLFLYVLMRRGAADRLLFCHRCCKTAEEEEPGQNIPAIEPSVDHVSSV